MVSILNQNVNFAPKFANLSLKSDILALKLDVSKQKFKISNFKLNIFEVKIGNFEASTGNESQLKNPDISGAIFTLNLSILILNYQCIEGARDVRVL